MKTTKIVHVARMFQHNVAYSLCWNRNIPILVSRGRGVRDKVAAHPFDRVADIGRDLSGLELQLVDRNADRFARHGGSDQPHYGQNGQPVHSKNHRPFLFQRLGDLLRVLFVTLKNLQTRLEKVLQFCIAGIGNEHGLKRIVDCLVIGDFVVGISVVKRRALLSFPARPLALQRRVPVNVNPVGCLRR